MTLWQSRHLTPLGTLHTWMILQMPRGSCQLSLQRTGRDHEDAPALHGWAPDSRSEMPQSHTAWSNGYCPEPVSVEDAVLHNLELHDRNDNMTTNDIMCLCDSLNLLTEHFEMSVYYYYDDVTFVVPLSSSASIQLSSVPSAPSSSPSPPTHDVFSPLFPSHTRHINTVSQHPWFLLNKLHAVTKQVTVQLIILLLLSAIKYGGLSMCQENVKTDWMKNVLIMSPKLIWKKLTQKNLRLNTQDNIMQLMAGTSKQCYGCYMTTFHTLTGFKSSMKFVPQHIYS